jgi:putative transposase
MARPLRLEFPGAIYHITARGNARQPIVAGDTDRRRLVDALVREVT